MRTLWPPSFVRDEVRVLLREGEKEEVEEK